MIIVSCSSPRGRAPWPPSCFGIRRRREEGICLSGVEAKRGQENCEREAPRKRILSVYQFEPQEGSITTDTFGGESRLEIYLATPGGYSDKVYSDWMSGCEIREPLVR